MSKARDWDLLREAEQEVLDLEEEYHIAWKMYGDEAEETEELEYELNQAQNALAYLEHCWRSDYGSNFPEERPAD